MFQLTEIAAQQLKKIKDEVRGERPGSVLRLVRTPEAELKLAVDAPAEGDRELYCADEVVLVVDPDTSESLANQTLDYLETPRGHAFVFEQRAE
ncbi:MAG: hypothetical protein ACE5H6_03380 [Dehalococcoidia bacterium]